MNLNEIATKQDILLLHEKLNKLLDSIDSLRLPAVRNGEEIYLTSKEVIQTYKISKSHLTDLRIEGRIPYTDAFGVLLYPKSQIEQILNKGGQAK